MLQTKNLTKIYHQGTAEIYAVNDCSILINKGEMVAITGASGSGKTTLLQLCGGLIDSSSGEVFIDGEDISCMMSEKLEKIRRQKIGFIFQEYNLIPFLTAKENIIVPALADRNDYDKEYLTELAEMLGIKERLKHMPSQLSGGEQQRVAIARALINKPKLLLADEPTGALDSANGKQCMELLCEINKKGTTVVIVTHDDSVAACCDRIIRMKDGKLVTE